MKYAHLLILLIALSFNSICSAQHHSVSSAINLSYSGLSQSIRYGIHGEIVSLQVGPKVSYSKNRTAFSSLPGISFQVDYHPDCKGKFFLLYEFLPLKVDGGTSVIHETYVGYGYRWRFNENWSLSSGIGMGFYYESGSIVKSYQIQGLSYCSNAGITYRF